MDMQLASDKLSSLDLKLQIDDLQASVLWFRVMEHQGDWLISRHTHSSYEFHFVRSGGCRVKLDDGGFSARQGEFYLTAPGVFHEQSPLGDGSYIEYSINYDLTAPADGQGEGSHLLHALREAPCRPYSDIFGAMEYFSAALEAAQEQPLGYYNSIQSLCVLILTTAARTLCGTAARYTVPTRVAKDEYRFTQLQKYMQDNLCSNISARDLENHMYLSERQIRRIIQQKTGKTTKEYINFLRLQRAKQLLQESNCTVREISDQLGFTSEYYFNHFFKREEGYPPGVYRKNVQKP